ncbi:ankyrin repeat-containing domain protein [Xylaria arbuscula]|nr:ankyrin repeat-containing domain protein [Xylaria arbuscula]
MLSRLFGILKTSFSVDGGTAEMLISNHPLAAVMVHAVMTGPSLLQRCPPDRPFVAVAELVDYFRENSDVGTALAIQEILLLPWSTSDTLPTNAARLLKYCELYLETTDRLEAILEDGVSFMPPPLHYFLLLAKEKNLSLPITPVHSHLISMKDYFGRSLLHMTLDLGIMANVLPLIKLGVSTDTGDNLGRRPIHIACSVNSEAEVLQYILEHTVNCEVEDSLGRSALHYASSCGNESAIQLLLERGASIHHQDQDGKLPILWAVKHGHSAAVDLLLRNGATAKSLDRHGGMLLSIAVENRYTDIIQSLVRYGANTNTENAYDKTALHAAAERGHTTTTETLIRNGANIDINAQIALHTAAKRGHIATVEALIRNGANIDIRDSYSKTALHAAANRGHIATIEALIRNGANIGIRDLLGRTALHDAVSSRHVDTIKILLNNGADINLLSCNQTDRLIQLLAADTPNA